MNTDSYNWIPRLNGGRWRFERPETWTVDLDEIARGLANTCRFSGLVERYYSVAQHSWLVARLVRPELRPLAMIHDAGELYSGGDVPRPLNTPEWSGALPLLENEVMDFLCRELRQPRSHEEILTADDAVLLAEGAQILGRADLMAEGEAAEITIHPVGPEAAYHTWLGYWREYTEAAR